MFSFSNHGSICILTPLDDVAQEWVEEHIPDDATTWGGGIVIEPRYVQPILDGIAEAGLEVQ